MKPRPLSLADENPVDTHVWVMVLGRSRWMTLGTRATAHDSDTRDADLMLGLGTWGRRGTRRMRRAWRAYQGCTIDPRTGIYVWLSDHDISYFA